MQMLYSCVSDGSAPCPQRLLCYIGSRHGRAQDQWDAWL